MVLNMTTTQAKSFHKHLSLHYSKNRNRKKMIKMNNKKRKKRQKIENKQNKKSRKISKTKNPLSIPNAKV